MNDNDVPDTPERVEIRYSPENTRIGKSGGRRCVTCVREGCRRDARNSYRLKEEARRRYARRRAPFKEAA